MADNEPTISMAGINAPPLYRLVEDGDKTVIMTADTNTPMWVINGKIGGDTVETMTTAERTAITPEAGQLIWDTDQEVLYAGDGETAGGVQVSGTGGGAYTQGYGIEITGGATISRAAYGTIETVDVSGASPSVTMVPGHAYSINATTKAVTLNVASFNANQFGIDEGHLEIFVAGTGYVVTGANVELANALEPDAINYCTVRFVGGVAKIALEDNIGGYIVVSPTGTTQGTLPYGITSASQEYIAFDATTNGSTIDLSGSTASAEKHLVGNGYTSTTLTGAVDCGTSRFTVANLSLSNVQVTSGTMTLGDAWIPSGSTVAVSGGGLAVEKVTGDGGTIDLGRNGRILVSSGGATSASGVTITGGSSTNGGGMVVAAGGSVVLSNCVFSANKATFGGGIFNYQNATITGCTFTGNQGIGTVYNSKTMILSSVAMSSNTGLFPLLNNGSCTVQDCEIETENGAAIKNYIKLTLLGGNNLGGIVFEGGQLDISGNNIIRSVGFESGYPGSVTISSGASINLTSSINPGGGITVLTGGCTVNGNAIPAGTYTSIDSNGQPTE